MLYFLAPTRDSARRWRKCWDAKSTKTGWFAHPRNRRPAWKGYLLPAMQRSMFNLLLLLRPKAQLPRSQSITCFRSRNRAKFGSECRLASGMKKAFEIALGIVTSVGGFLEIGSIATAAQAGALFGFQLLWAILLGGLCLILLVEEAGRLAAVSRHTIVDAIRERCGFSYAAFLVVVLGLGMRLVLAAELGGVCIGLEFLTGVHFQWWAIPVGLLTWLIIWKGTFGFIEEGVSLLGLVTLCFVVAAWKLHPDWHEAAEGLGPTLPSHEA